jgi:hypothetical protein
MIATTDRALSSMAILVSFQEMPRSVRRKIGVISSWAWGHSGRKQAPYGDLGTNATQKDQQFPEGKETGRKRRDKNLKQKAFLMR